MFLIFNLKNYSVGLDATGVGREPGDVRAQGQLCSVRGVIRDEEKGVVTDRVTQPEAGLTVGQVQTPDPEIQDTL